MALIVTEKEWRNILENLKDGVIVSVISRNADGTRTIEIYNLDNEPNENQIKELELETIDREEFLKRINSLEAGETLTVKHK